MRVEELVERAVVSTGYVALLADGGVNIRDVRRCAELMSDAPIPEAVVRDRIDAMSGYARVLRDLLRSPGIPQRTPEWYAARENMVTGSELASATTVSKKRQFFQRKMAGPEGWNDLKDKPAIRWGVLYEPVACALYEKRSGTKVHEFGLLPHKHIPGFGASPDGISDIGIMLEIKCPYTRVITGEVPSDYYAQIQAQLDTTGLKECDFLECKFEEYDDASAFANDVSPYDQDLTRGGMEKGAVWLCDDQHEVRLGEAAVEWSTERPGAKFWRLLVYSRVRVQKSDAFMDGLKTEIEDTVRKIAEYKADPCAMERDYPKKPDWNLSGFSFRNM